MLISLIVASLALLPWAAIFLYFRFFYGLPRLAPKRIAAWLCAVALIPTVALAQIWLYRSSVSSSPGDAFLAMLVIENAITVVLLYVLARRSATPKVGR